MTETILAKTGLKLSSRMVIPAIFVLEPGDVPAGAKADPNDAESVKLWTLNHLPQLYLLADPDDDAAGWQHRRTDWEGFLVETRRNRKGFYPWTSWPKLDGGKAVAHRLYFTTLPLLASDVEAVCEEFGSQSALTPEDLPKLSRPYPDDLAASAEKVLKRAMLLVRVDPSQLPRAARRAWLSHAEAVLLGNLPPDALKPYRDAMRLHRLTEEKLRELKLALAGVRGTYRFELVDSKVPRALAKEGPLPQLLAPPPLSAVNQRMPLLRGGFEEGPWWMTVTAADTQQAQTTAPAGGGKGGAQAAPSGQASGNRLLVHAMDATYPLPKAVPGLPAVDDPVIGRIAAETADIFRRIGRTTGGPSTSEGDVVKEIERLLRDSSYRQDSRWIRSFFYFSESEDGWNGCIVLALSDAASHWRYSVESEMVDLMRAGKAAPIVLRSHVVVGFATGSDVLSESASPLHPYQQLKEWWEGLSGTDRDEVAAADSVQIVGYSSRLGGPSERNVKLRRNRAWKTARSLELVLGGDSDFSQRSGGKMLRLIAGPAPLPTAAGAGGGGAGSSKMLSVYYRAEENMSRFHDPGVYKSLGARICDVLFDSPVARLTVRGVPEDNDPRDRVAIVEFRRTLPERTVQFVKQQERINAAHAVAGYRVIQYTEGMRGKDPVSRMLLYAIPARWK